MEYKEKQIKDYLVQYEVIFSKEEISKKKNEILKEVKNNVAVPGYRKGKAPMWLIESRYKDFIEEELTKYVLAEFYKKLVDDNKENGKEPLHFDLKESDFEKSVFTIEIEYMPQIDFEYKNIEIEEPEIDIKNEHIQKAYSDVLKNFSKWNDTDNVEESVMIELENYEEEIDGKIENKIDKYPLIYSEKKTPTKFYQMFKDIKKGEKYEKVIEYGEEEGVSERLKNKKVIYRFTVKSIKKEEKPEENEELFQKIYKDAKTKDDILNKIKEDIEKNTFAEVKKDSVFKIYKKILANHPFELPPHYLEEMIDEVYKNEKEKYEKQYNMKLSEKDFPKESIRDGVIEGIKINHIRRYIKKKENIEVTDDDLKKFYKEFAEANNISVAGVENFYKTNKNLLDKLKDDLLNQKIDDFLYENAKIKKIKAEDFEKKQKELKESKKDDKKEIKKESKEGENGKEQ